MKTRKALDILSKGKKTYHRINSTLVEKSDKYLASYEETQSDIIAKQNAHTVNMPFVESLRRKVSKMISGPDNSLPIVARFDLYTGVKKISERSNKDNGLTRLASHLEKVWKEDPVGTLTYGEVNALVKVYKDQYPRSKAADAIEAECSRVGLHKLPVAKLARIASDVDSQESYDALMEANGLSGSRPEQVRARALVRGLVAIKSGVEVDHGAPSVKSDVSIGERVASKVDSLNKNAEYGQALQLLDEAANLSVSLEHALGQASTEMFEDGLNEAGQKLLELSKSLDSWMGGLTDARDEAQVPAEHVEPEETPEEAAGMTKKWYDPRSWGFKPMSRLIDASIAAADVAAEPELKEQIEAFASKLAQLAPVSEPEHEELESPLEEAIEHEMGVELNPGMADGQVQENELEQGQDMVKEIDEAAQEIIEDAPPEAHDWIQHEMAEGHSAPPGTATWGAEEVLNEGHKSAPPSDAWLEEELAEMEGKMGMTAAKGKGIPTPKGKIKSQPPVQSSAKVPDDAGKMLRGAEMIEADLLSGKTVRIGNISIFINANDEIELWNKDAGQACGLADMDIAIADFMKSVKAEVKAVDSKPVKATYVRSEVVDVPCEACGTATVFQRASSTDDNYACDCGHLVSASSVEELIKLAAIEVKYVNVKQAQEMAVPVEAPVEQEELLPPMPLGELANAAFMNYKAQGLNFADALQAFMREHKERLESAGPDAAGEIIGAMAANYTSGAMPAPMVEPEMAVDMPAEMPMMASKEAQSKMNMDPKVNQQQPDAVSAPKDLGPDSEQKEMLPLPGKIDPQPNQPKGKMSDTNMGKDTSNDDALPNAGKPKANHPPKGKLPDTNMGEDSEGAEAFKSPALGSSPKVSK